MSPKTTWPLALALVTALGAQSRPSITAVPRETVREAAARVDALVAAALEEHGIVPGPTSDDATFLRRVHLDVAGRIPTAAEAEAFLRSQDADARERLVDELLDGRGHESRMFHWWADLLRIRTRLNAQVSGEPYIAWLETALAEGRAYDDMVRELLTAEGPAHAPGNGATGYWLRDRGMPEDAMANTVRVFLGTRLECAQCHDHPFDRWKQREFYAMAAFVGGIDYRVRPASDPNVATLLEKAREVRRQGDSGRTRALQRLLRPLLAGVSGTGTGCVRLPDDYRYDDARPRDLVAAQPIFGTVDLEVALPTERRARRGRLARRGRTPPLPEIGSRAAFAEWLTSPENPRFTTVIVNRTWQSVFGRGLIEPVDDLRDASVASNPALLAYLEDLMRELDYDLRQFRRVLLYTTAFQRVAVPEEAPDAPPSAPLVRRLSAEQLWDSIVTLAVPDVDATLAPPVSDAAQRVFDAYTNLVSASPAELDARLEREVLRYSDPAAYRAELRRERRAAQQRERERAAPLLRALARARRRGDQEAEARVVRALEELGIDARRRARSRGAVQLVRASDLPQPAPEGHFLRMFGQSDREQIEGAEHEADVPQALTLLNGIVDRELARPGSAVMAAVAGERGAVAKIRRLWLAVLSRQPTGAEVDAWRRDFERDVRTATVDLLWVLVNSHEFRFLR